MQDLVVQLVAVLERLRNVELVVVRVRVLPTVGRLVEHFCHSRRLPRRYLLAAHGLELVISLVLVVHKDAAFLESSKLEVLCGFWVEGDQLVELARLQVHRHGLHVVGLLLGLADVLRRKGLVLDVALKVEKQVVVIEDGVDGQDHELVLVLGVEFDTAGENEDELVCLATLVLDHHIGPVQAHVQLDDEFVAETRLARVEEVLEALDEFAEDL